MKTNIRLLALMAFLGAVNLSNASTPVSHQPTFGGVAPDSTAKNISANKSALATANIVLNSTNNVANMDIVDFYFFPSPGPNDQVAGNAFDNWRDTLGLGLGLYAGNPIASSNRTDNPSGVEIRNCFEQGDVTIPSTSTTNFMWRAVLNPTNPAYVGQIGGHGYVSTLIVAHPGHTISASGVSWRVVDDKGLLDNKSSLATNVYEHSLYGIINGPSGNPFGNDVRIVDYGTAGTNQVNAIWFVGGRFGVWVNGAQGISDFNNYIPTNGLRIAYYYSYDYTSNSVSGNTTNIVDYTQTVEKDVMLYRQGMIPLHYQDQTSEIFKTPIGLMFSLFCRDEGEKFTVHSGRTVDHISTLEGTGICDGWLKTFPTSGTGINAQGYINYEPQTNTITIVNPPGLQP